MGALTIATPHQADDVRSLPMQASPVTLKYKHLTTTSGVVTVIARTFADPSRCRLCPSCAHDAGGCLVIAPEYVDPASCGRYRLRGQGLPRLGV